MPIGPRNSDNEPHSLLLTAIADDLDGNSRMWTSQHDATVTTFFKARIAAISDPTPIDNGQPDSACVGVHRLDSKEAS